jgi:hypothetical protein
MVQREIDNEFVLTIYGWFQSAMRSVGRNPKLAQARNVANTYAFRNVKMFAERCYNKWELDDRAVRTLVYDIVKYADREGILNKGTMMLNMGTVLEICKKSLQESIEAEENLATELSRCKAFLDEVGKDNLATKLVQPVTIGGYSYLVYWFNLGYLTPTYIAISRRCLKAVHALPLSERNELPDDSELLRICTHTVANDNVNELREIMGQDLRVPPTVRV